jgi:lipoprotein-anchoring transpeptidase ErfK/SrfK
MLNGPAALESALGPAARQLGNRTREFGMRTLKLLGIIGAVVVTALLSGAAAGTAPTSVAIVSSALMLPANSVSTAGAVVQPAAVAPPVARAVAPAPAAAPVAAPAAPARPAPAAVPVKPRAVPGTPCMSTARACVDLSANRAWLISGGAVQYGPVSITHGRAGYRTPPGTFKVSFKNINHRSSIYDNAPMPYSVFFNGGIAFHQGSLKQLSHGCIHLSRAAAQKFFGTLGVGDVVQVAR